MLAEREGGLLMVAERERERERGLLVVAEREREREDYSR